MTISIRIRMTIKGARSDLQIKDQIRSALSLATTYSSNGVDEEEEREDDQCRDQGPDQDDADNDRNPAFLSHASTTSQTIMMMTTERWIVILVLLRC